MRKFIIDTDTASDDAVALIMALKSPDIEVLAITCTAGVMTGKKTSRNARISVDVAGTDTPPVYVGMEKPLVRAQTAVGENAHGADGLGNMNYPDPLHPLSEGHAVDKIIELVKKEDDIEIITLGPLTNIAMAIILAPDTMKKVKNITVMGGQYRMLNPCTANAEFNIWIDAEATKILLDSDIPVTMVPLDVCYGGTEINAEDRARLRSYQTRAGDFFVDANRILLKYNQDSYDKDIISLPDPTAVAVAINPCIVESERQVEADIEIHSPMGYGQLLYNYHSEQKKPNCRLITKINGALFKEMVFMTAQTDGQKVHFPTK